MPFGDRFNKQQPTSTQPTRRGGFGSAYAGSKSTPTPTPKHGGGGLLGAVGHAFGQTGADLYHAAINIPGGLYHLGDLEVQALKHDYHEAIHHPLRTQSLHSFIHGDNNPASHQLYGLERGYVHQLNEERQHPLRHPGYTLLDALSFADPALGAGGRAAAAARAARAGEGAGEIAKAALRRPTHGVRTLKVGNLEVHPETSRGHLGAAVQKASDKALMRAAERRPGGVGEALLHRRIGKVTTARAREAERIAKGAGASLIALGRKLKPSEQKALQVVAEQAPLEGRIAAAEARAAAATGAEQGRHAAEADLLRESAKHLTVENGLPALHEPKLKAIYQRMEHVAADRETLLKNLGMLTDEATASRKTNAGRVALGARYEAPTPGKLGISPALGRAVRDRDRLQRRFDRLYETQRGKFVDTQRPRTVEEAQARLAELEKEHGAALDKIAAQMFGPIDKREVAFRNAENARARRQAAGVTRAGKKSGAAGRKSKLRPTVKEERRAEAERRIEDAIARNPNHPIASRWTARTSELEQLRGALNPDLFEKIEPSKLGTVTETRFQRRHGKIERIGGALSVAQDRVQQLEQRVAGGVKPTGFHGHEDFVPTGEAVRVPDVATRRIRGGGTVFGKIGNRGTIGHLRAPGSTTHSYTGALREAALRRQDTTRLVGESSIEAAKYAGLDLIHKLVRQAAQPFPERVDDIAVRLDNMKAGERMPLDVRKFVEDPEEFFKESSPSDQARMVDQVRQQLFIDTRSLSPEAKARFAQLEEEGKIGWVPRRILGDLAKPQAPLSAVTGSRPLKVYDAINNASRFAILYLKPAYALPNLLGNVALNVLQQGWASVPNLRYAARLNARLGPELAARVDAIMGEGFAAAASAHGMGPMSGLVDKASRIWSKGVDTPFRRSSFMYEAKQAGYRTPAELERLLTDPALHDHLIDISLRANREIIDYANLSPVEREVIRRVVFFYPWVKGSTQYAGRLVRERPVKTAISAHIGEVGHEEAQRELGPVPSYLEGVFPAGGGLVNPSSAAILQTPAVLGNALQGLATGNISKVAEASNFYTPALALALSELTRTNTQSGRTFKPGTNFGEVARAVLGDQLPQVSLARNVRQGLHGGGQTRIFPPSPESALAQFLVGGLAPRPYNPLALRRAAYLERRKMKTGR